jgi:Ca2+-transporting ATPase
MDVQLTERAEFAVQILIVFVGGAAFQVTPLPGREWGIAIALGFVSIPLGALIRCIPNGPTERALIKLRILPDPHALPVARESEQHVPPAWNYAIDRVTDSLGTFSHVRGARMRASSFVGRSRTGARATRPRSSALLAMVPTLVASTVGARWTPAAAEGASLSDPARADPSRSSAALWAAHVEVHPDTKTDDYAFRRWGRPTVPRDEESA